MANDPYTLHINNRGPFPHPPENHKLIYDMAELPDVVPMCTLQWNYLLEKWITCKWVGRSKDDIDPVHDYINLFAVPTTTTPDIKHEMISLLEGLIGEAAFEGLPDTKKETTYKLLERLKHDH